MKILLTGSIGFIGSHLHQLIPEAIGCDIRENSLHDIRLDDIQLGYPDITHVFHLAALKGVAPSEGGYAKDYIETNCWGTANVLRSFPNARIIFVSSSAAEECKSIYGMTKKFGELVAMRHPNCLAVRLYNVFGEGQSLEYAPAVPAFINARLKGHDPIIFGDGLQTRDFTYVGDVVHELKRLMFETDLKGLYHLGYGEPISVLDLLKEIYGYLPNVHFVPELNFNIRNSCSPTKMENIMYGRMEGLRRTIKSYG